MNDSESILLLHASDFHVHENEGDPLALAHDIRQLFAFDAEQMAKNIGSPTALVFSGDITFGGVAEQYDVARKMFTDILARLDLQEQRIIVVPGNHDVDRRKAINLKARMLRDQLRASTDSEAEKEFIAKREELLEPLSAFQEFAMSYDCLIQGENGYWEIDNQTKSTASEYLNPNFNVLIRGISTVHVSDRNDDQMDNSASSNDDGSHMYIARGQLFCDPTTAESPFRILVGHHPPSWWRFSESRKKLADARYHLHLFGHEHQFAPQQTGNAICVKAGAINPEESHKVEARYNWIKISRNEKGYIVRIWSRVFDHERHEFTEDKSWPAGQGYLISHALDTKAILLEPEENLNVSTKPDSSASVEDEKIDIDNVELEKKPHDLVIPSSHTIRFSLFSQNHAKYALIFKTLGYEPDNEQKNTLGGLEYYEEALQELLLPEKIEKLIDVMKKEGINVSQSN